MKIFWGHCNNILRFVSVFIDYIVLVIKIKNTTGVPIACKMFLKII